MKAWMSRNIKEILRDPLTLIFGIGLPILLLGMMTVINAAVPVQVWQFLPENFVPGMAVFSLSFVTLFSGLLLAKDRSSAFLSRVCASPLRASAYILGYALPLMLVGLLQCIACLLAGLLFGLAFTWRIFAVVLACLPANLLFVMLGLHFGTLLNDKQVGGISGGVMVNVTSLAGGIWFDLRMFSGTWQQILHVLPFAPAVDCARAAYARDWPTMLPNLLIVLAGSLFLAHLVVLLFSRRKASGRLVG